MDQREADLNESLRLERRAFLRRAGISLPFMYAAIAELHGAQQTADTSSAAEPRPFPGMITRQKNPDNLEFPFPTLHEFITPNEHFYTRTHFNVPRLQGNEWKLSVEGHVERPVELDLNALQTMERQTLTCLLECSGNSRVFLDPPQSGIRWEQGAVGTAEWTGVPLAALLQQAGVKSNAVEVILEGHDRGSSPQSPGEIAYARSIPLAKATSGEVLLAYQMNGAELPADHGYPLRAVVAGWYGMASVKWLKRIVVTEKPFQGFFQTFMYSIWTRSHDGLPSLLPVTEIDVKSQIARPALNEIVSAGAMYDVFGAAWAGKSKIAKVEVTTDGGQSWSNAALDEKSLPFAWRFWRFQWQVPEKAGRYVLMSRATDEQGRVQPLERDKDRRDAMITHLQPIEVFVR